MLKRLRRSVMALGIAGVVTASALGAGIATSGTAEAWCERFTSRSPYMSVWATPSSS